VLDTGIAGNRALADTDGLIGNRIAESWTFTRRLFIGNFEYDFELMPYIGAGRDVDEGAEKLPWVVQG
jgi:hypothetical protein